jgi:hypothetical protein
MLKYCTVFGEKIRPVEIERETKNFVVMQNGIRRAFLCTTFGYTLCCRSASDLPGMLAIQTRVKSGFYQAFCIASRAIK